MSLAPFSLCLCLLSSLDLPLTAMGWLSPETDPSILDFSDSRIVSQYISVHCKLPGLLLVIAVKTPLASEGALLSPALSPPGMKHSYLTALF